MPVFQSVSGGDLVVNKPIVGRVFVSHVHFQAKTCHSYHLSTCIAPWIPQGFGHTMVLFL